MNKRLNEIASNLNEKFSGNNKLKIIVIIGIIGIGLILFSELISTTPKTTSKPAQGLNTDTNAYKVETEAELVKILSQIQGVGEVKVMLTIEGSTEFIFAEEINSKREDSSDKKSEDYQNKYVIVDNGATKEALVKKVLKPKINGVIVVCEGGNIPIVCEKIYKAVSTVLGLSAGDICVAKG